MSKITQDRDSLINDLAETIKPIERAGSTWHLALLWLLIVGSMTILVITSTGPIRPDSLSDLITSPRYAIENILGLITVILLLSMAFRSAIPGMPNQRIGFMVTTVIFLMWILSLAFSLIEPAIPATMAGKREHCHLEVFLYGLPGLFIGIAMIKKLWPVNSLSSGLMIGLAAGTVPAIVMQFTCMYMPVHNLIYHVLPGVMLGPIGALLALSFFRNK